jgi:hypothetical protein
MAAINDLMWSQLSAKLSANTIATSNGSLALPAGVYINVSALTGDTIDSVSDMSVVEAMVKLLKAAREAQITANTGQAVGEQLNAFPQPSFGNTTVIDQGLASIANYSVQARVIGSFDTAIGPTT